MTSRRRFLARGLQLATTLAGASLAAPWANVRPAQAQESHTIIGTSQDGRLLVVYHLGSGSIPVLLLGAQHGGPEANTMRLVNQLYTFFTDNPTAIPSSIRLDLLPETNPDGLVHGSRLFRSGVDPNRNWGSPEWQTDAWDSNGVFRIGLGGPEPFSEPETRALRDYLLATNPALVVNYHSRGGFMFGSRAGGAERISAAYASASRYLWPQPTPGGGGSGLLGYRATGSMNVWLGTQSIPGILVELSDSQDPEFARNLAGVRAALNLIAAAG